MLAVVIPETVIPGDVLVIQGAFEPADAAAIKFKVGATNGYNIFGSATGEKSLPAGAQSLEFWNDLLPDVGASAKNIDVTSSDADAKYDIELVAG